MTHEVSIAINGFCLQIKCLCGKELLKTVNELHIPEIVEVYSKHVKNVYEGVDE